MSVPATVVQHQQENQATTVLAWLADQSLPLARALAQLFLAEKEPAASVDAIGARTQVSLHRPTGGTVFPDLSIDGSGRAFQILVEVKIGAEFHSYVDASGQQIPQQELYRQIWSALPAGTEAKVRAVSTLTRLGSTAPPDLNTLRGREVSWIEVGERLAELICAGAVDASVRPVAKSFVRAIETRIAPQKVDPEEVQRFLGLHRPLVDSIVSTVIDQLGAVAAPGGSGSDYVGARAQLTDTAGEPLFLRVYATPAGGRLNVAGWSDAVIAVLERISDGTLDPPSREAATAAGFHKLRDLDGYYMHRAIWASDGATASQIAAELVERIRDTKLISS
jgi:hypothetical protein